MYPLVSIGMPVYNGAEYLQHSLQSLITQDYPNIELVISDNASTDATASIYQEVAARDHRVQYHRNTENHGAVQNFNRVFHLSKGEYFMWASYDDLWHPKFISKLVRVLENDPEVVLAFCGVRRIDTNGRVFGSRTNLGYGKDQGTSLERAIANVRRNACSIFYGLIRSSILAKTGLLHEMGIPHDNALLAELACYGQFNVVEEELFFRRKHLKQDHALRPRPKLVIDGGVEQWISSLPLQEGEKQLFLKAVARVVRVYNRGETFRKRLSKAWYRFLAKLQR